MSAHSAATFICLIHNTSFRFCTSVNNHTSKSNQRTRLMHTNIRGSSIMQYRIPVKKLECRTTFRTMNFLQQALHMFPLIAFGSPSSTLHNTACSKSSTRSKLAVATEISGIWDTADRWETSTISICCNILLRSGMQFCRPVRSWVSFVV